MLGCPLGAPGGPLGMPWGGPWGTSGGPPGGAPGRPWDAITCASFFWLHVRCKMFKMPRSKPTTHVIKETPIATIKHDRHRDNWIAETHVLHVTHDRSNELWIEDLCFIDIFLLCVWNDSETIRDILPVILYTRFITASHETNIFTIYINRSFTTYTGWHDC